MSYPAAFFALLFSSAALAAAVFPDLSDGSGASARRLGLLKMRFEGLLREARCPYGVVCVAQGGRVVMAEAVGIPGVENGAELKRRAEGRAYPLGESSLAAVTFAAVKMSDAGKLDFKWTVSDRFSLFSPPKGAEKSASFENMLYMRAGFNPSDAKLFPDSSEPRDLLEFSSQCFSGGTGERGKYSPICAAAAGYALGYEHSKLQKNLKKSFAAFMKKYFFDPLGISEPKYRAFDSALFPAYAVALAPHECARWLAAETAAGADSPLARRRMSPPLSRLGMGWFDSSRGGLPAQVASSFFQGCANEIAVFPSRRTAVAFFAAVDSGRLAAADAKTRAKYRALASGACSNAAEFFGEMLADAARPEKSEPLSPTLSPKKEDKK